MIGLALVADLSVDVVRSAVESLADARIVARSMNLARARDLPWCSCGGRRGALGAVRVGGVAAPNAASPPFTAELLGMAAMLFTRSMGGG